MGWRPWEVRSATLYDFVAAFEGWSKANGTFGRALTEDDVAWLEEMMERYPDE